MKVKQTCPLCGGKGRLPPLGVVNLTMDNPVRRDVTRHFERLCRMEDGGCDGTGWRWVEVSVAENNAVTLSALALFERLRKRL